MMCISVSTSVCSGGGNGERQVSYRLECRRWSTMGDWKSQSRMLPSSYSHGGSKFKYKQAVSNGEQCR